MAVVTGSTLVELFTNRTKATPDGVAMRTKVGGTWTAITYGELGARTREVANGLVSLGVAPGSCVSLLSKNRAEWILSDLAILSAGARTVPVYVTSSPRQVGHIVGHSESSVVIVEDRDQLDKVLKVREELPLLKTVVVISGDGAGEYPQVISFDELRKAGAAYATANPTAVDERIATIGPDDIATIVYTSGTTGDPKGVLLTHANFTKTVAAGLGVMGLTGGEHRLISYLPLSHIFERLIGEVAVIYLGAEVWFAESIERLVGNLKECRPTLFIGVPRVYEKFYAGVLAKVAQEPGVKRALITKAVEAGKAKVALEQAGKPVPFGLARKHALLDHLVLSKMRHELGMDACTLAVTGAAPISVEVLSFVHALGIRLVEGYGLTETTAPVSVNPVGKIRIGTVGPPLPGVQVRFDEDGELLVKGYNVFQGYFRNDAATDAAMTPDGFFRTGDVGQLDPAGYIKITDRKKDIIVTAGGKNVAPQMLEERLKSEPIISQALVIGDRRPYLVALITLDADVCPTWAANQGITYTDMTDLSANPKVLEAVGTAVERVNGELSHAEGIKKWSVLPRDFSLDAEEITPTLKVRRRVITEKYGDAIERMYAK